MLKKVTQDNIDVGLHVFGQSISLVHRIVYYGVITSFSKGRVYYSSVHSNTIKYKGWNSVIAVSNDPADIEKVNAYRQRASERFEAMRKADDEDYKSLFTE